MPNKRDTYRPCSESDLRSAALRMTHEKLREMEEQGTPTLGMFGVIEKDEKRKLRIFGEYMMAKGLNPVMTFEELKTSMDEYLKRISKPTKK